MLWLSQVSRVCSGIEPVGLDDLAARDFGWGGCLESLLGCPRRFPAEANDMPLQELAGVLTSDGGVEDPRHAQEVFQGVLSVPNELKFSAKALGTWSATVSSSRALLELALQLRVDLFPETEQQALLLVSLGKELALPLGHLIALARNDRNPKFRALLVDQLREQTPDSFAGLLVQECFGKLESPVAELVNGNVDQSSPVNTTTTAVVAGGNKAAPLTLQLPKLVNPTTASIKLEPSLVKLESSSLTRSLAEKTKPKPPPTIVKITTTTTTASTSTAAQLRNKLKQRT
ncbi:hypothetical protein BASA82_000439 [Batrachochytrium salamandrivorans]|nr:hypothetical protein BASA82_000439 [Batrachochytrium salamandrivorans]